MDGCRRNTCSLRNRCQRASEGGSLYDLFRSVRTKGILEWILTGAGLLTHPSADGSRPGKRSEKNFRHQSRDLESISVYEATRARDSSKVSHFHRSELGSSGAEGASRGRPRPTGQGSWLPSPPPAARHPALSSQFLIINQLRDRIWGIRTTIIFSLQVLSICQISGSIAITTQVFFLRVHCESCEWRTKRSVVLMRPPPLI